MILYLSSSYYYRICTYSYLVQLPRTVTSTIIIIALKFLYVGDPVPAGAAVAARKVAPNATEGAEPLAAGCGERPAARTRVAAPLGEGPSRTRYACIYGCCIWN